MAEPYFVELKSLSPTDNLYRLWVEYALSLGRADVLFIVRNGLTHQARSLRSMIKEAVGSTVVPQTLWVKLELLVRVSQDFATKIRE